MSDAARVVEGLDTGSFEFELSQMRVFELLVLRLREIKGETVGTMRARHTNLEQFLSLRSLNFHHPKLIVLLCDARWEGEGVMRANTPTGTLTASALVL